MLPKGSKWPFAQESMVILTQLLSTRKELFLTSRSTAGQYLNYLQRIICLTLEHNALVGLAVISEFCASERESKRS